MQMIFSESERLQGGLHDAPWKGTTQPLAARPEPPAPLHPPQYARHGQGIPGSPAAPHASGPLGLPFGPGDGAGSGRLAGDRTGRHGWRYAPQGVEPPASSPRLSDRCPVPAAAGAGRRHPAPGTAALVSLYWEAGPVRASVFVIKRCPLGSSQLDSWGEACWDTARWFP